MVLGSPNGPGEMAIPGGRRLRSLGDELGEVDVHHLLDLVLVVAVLEVGEQLLLQRVPRAGLGDVLDRQPAEHADRGVERLAAVDLLPGLVGQLEGDAEAQVVAGGEVDLLGVEREDGAGLRCGLALPLRGEHEEVGRGRGHDDDEQDRDELLLALLLRRSLLLALRHGGDGHGVPPWAVVLVFGWSSFWISLSFSRVSAGAWESTMTSTRLLTACEPGVRGSTSGLVCPNAAAVSRAAGSRSTSW